MTRPILPLLLNRIGRGIRVGNRREIIQLYGMSDLTPEAAKISNCGVPLKLSEEPKRRYMEARESGITFERDTL